HGVAAEVSRCEDAVIIGAPGVPLISVSVCTAFATSFLFEPRRLLSVQVAHAREPVPSLSEVFRQYAPFVWRALRRLGVPESDVEDVCQEVFVVVHRKLGDFEGRSSLRTWIYGICTRTASDYRRSGRVRREI